MLEDIIEYVQDDDHRKIWRVFKKVIAAYGAEGMSSEASCDDEDTYGRKFVPKSVPWRRDIEIELLKLERAWAALPKDRERGRTAALRDRMPVQDRPVTDRPAARYLPALLYAEDYLASISSLERHRLGTRDDITLRSWPTFESIP